MPVDKNGKNLAYAANAMKTGGKALGEITGEEEPELEQKSFFSDGFRRLTGNVETPKRKTGEGY